MLDCFFLLALRIICIIFLYIYYLIYATFKCFPFQLVFSIWASLIAHLVKNLPAMQETSFDSWVGKIRGRRDRLPTPIFLGFPVTQLVKNLPEMRETWVRYLGWEDPLEKGKITHSSILACRIPWTVESMGSQRVRHN